MLGYHSTYNTPITLSDDERRRHVYIIGRTGTGKSTVLDNMMHADIFAGRPFAFLDPNGDQALKTADSFPKPLIADKKIDRVVYFDPQDRTHVVGFNPIGRVPKTQHAQHAAHVLSSFKHLWVDSLCFGVE